MEKAPNQDFFSLVEESKTFNTNNFSVTRLLILSQLVAYGYDGAAFRELKHALKISDGQLYAHLKSLEKNGFIQIKKNQITFEKKKLDQYTITTEGKAEWNRINNWLKKIIQTEGNNHES